MIIQPGATVRDAAFPFHSSKLFKPGGSGLRVGSAKFPNAGQFSAKQIWVWGASSNAMIQSLRFGGEEMLMGPCPCELFKSPIALGRFLALIKKRAFVQELGNKIPRLDLPVVQPRTMLELALEGELDTIAFVGLELLS